MTKHKVEDLVGVLLDRAVARVEGRDAVNHHGVCSCWEESLGERLPFRPSSEWWDGGPIIEREKIATAWLDGRWNAWSFPTTGQGYYSEHSLDVNSSDADATGDMQLIAAMRAYVIAKLGVEIDL